MTNLGLFFAAVLIWGSTWLAIKFQLGSVSATVSVAWRFAIAAALLLAYSMWRGHSLRFARRDHLWMALQGVLLFGLNYIGVYLAEEYLTSGLVAVVFSLVVFFNIFGMRLFFGAPIRSAALLAAVIAVSGVTLVFLPELLRFSNSRTQLQGLGFALGATAVASLGNMTAVRNQHHQLPVIQVNAWSMAYGAAFVALAALATGQRFSFELSWPYVLSLAYLAVFGSALAFGAYLTLMKRIGAGQAAYTAVAIPVVALLLSASFEHLRWQLATVIGVLLCIVGTALALRRRAPSGAARA